MIISYMKGYITRSPTCLEKEPCLRWKQECRRSWVFGKDILFLVNFVCAPSALEQEIG
jgi:hypothetical protein